MFSTTEFYKSCEEWLSNADPVIQHVATTTMFLFEILKETVSIAYPALFGIQEPVKKQNIQQVTNLRLIKLMNATLGAGSNKYKHSATAEDWDIGCRDDDIDVGAGAGADAQNNKESKTVASVKQRLKHGKV